MPRCWWTRFALPVLIVGALLLAACTGGGAVGAEDGPPEVGKLAPDFTLERLDGGTLTLRELRGKVVLVNFWASWCGPCKVEMPIIQQVYDGFQSRGFEVVGVDFGEPRGDAEDFVARGGYTWPFVLDGDQAVAKRYNVLGLPASFLLDRSGIIRQIHYGPFVSKEQLEQKVAGLF